MVVQKFGKPFKYLTINISNLALFSQLHSHNTVGTLCVRLFTGVESSTYCRVFTVIIYD